MLFLTFKSEMDPSTDATAVTSTPTIVFRPFKSERDLAIVISMIEKELSEPYPIYTYRYFVQKWPELCLLAHFENDPDTVIGCIVSKLEN